MTHNRNLDTSIINLFYKTNIFGEDNIDYDKNKIYDNIKNKILTNERKANKTRYN